MLASIHPLGERSRSNRWGVTAGAFVAGAVLGGSLVGAAAGALGAVLDPQGVGVVVAAAVVCAIVALADARGVRPPGVHRQVDERWLQRYRGWVYGFSFGFQLGLGVVTIVITATVYAAVVLAGLTGSVTGGLLVGATFGAVRGASILVTRGSRDTAALRRLHARFERAAAGATRVTVAVSAVVTVVLVAGVAWPS